MTGKIDRSSVALDRSMYMPYLSKSVELCGTGTVSFYTLVTSGMWCSHYRGLTSQAQGLLEPPQY